MYSKAMKSCISYKATKSIEDRVSFFSCQFFETKKCSSKAADLFIWLLCLILFICCEIFCALKCIVGHHVGST